MTANDRSKLTRLPKGSIKVYTPIPGRTYIHKQSRSMFVVYVVSGAYEIGGRISNFFEWRRVLCDGTLGKVQRGYGGDWYTAENVHLRGDVKHAGDSF